MAWSRTSDASTTVAKCGMSSAARSLVVVVVYWMRSELLHPDAAQMSTSNSQMKIPMEQAIVVAWSAVINAQPSPSATPALIATLLRSAGLSVRGFRQTISRDVATLHRMPTNDLYVAITGALSVLCRDGQEVVVLDEDDEPNYDANGAPGLTDSLLLLLICSPVLNQLRGRRLPVVTSLERCFASIYPHISIHRRLERAMATTRHFSRTRLSVLSGHILNEIYSGDATE